MLSLRERNCVIEPEEEDLDQCEQDEDEDSESVSPDDQIEDEDEGGSSEVDTEECDRRRSECIDDMLELNEQFCKIKDQLFNERGTLIDLQLKAIKAGTDPEYLSRLDHLEQNRKYRKEVSDIRIGLIRTTIQEKFKSEELALSDTMQNDIDILYDELKQELEDKIKRLEEDRHNVDFPPDFIDTRNDRAKHRTYPFSDRRKKPAQVDGPYIIYNLTDEDILSDWTTIKRVAKQQNQRRKVEL